MKREKTNLGFSKDFFGILVGCLLGAVLAGATVFYFLGKQLVETTLSLSGMNDQNIVSTSSEIAFEAYRNKPPDMAIWLLKYHLRNIQRVEKRWNKSFDLSKKESVKVFMPGRQYFTLEYIKTYGRLAKLYEQLNDPQKKYFYIGKAVEKAKDDKMHNTSLDEQSLKKVIEQLDIHDTEQKPEEEHPHHH